MYNHDLKEQFLAWRGSAIVHNRGLFNRITNYEQEIGVDILDMPIRDYHMCLHSSGNAFMTGFIEVFRLTQHYGKWGQQVLHKPVQWVDCCDMYEAYLADADFPDVWLWDDVYAEMLSMYPITEGYAIWPILVFCWLGLTIQECCDVKNEDVDLKRKRIIVGNRSVELETDTQWKILATYANTTTGMRTQNRTFTVDLVDQGFFLKTTKTQNSRKVLRRWDADKILQMFEQYAKKCVEMKRQPQFSFADISRMGSYHRLWLKEQELGEELCNIATKEIQGIFHVKGVTPTRKMLLTEYQLYLKKLEERNQK